MDNKEAERSILDEDEEITFDPNSTPEESFAALDKVAIKPDKPVKTGGEPLLFDIDAEHVRETLNKIATFQKIILTTLKAEHDYGHIKGIDKPTLFKPGAEKIIMLMGLRTEYEILGQTADVEHGFFRYEIRCKVYKGDILVTEGLGACNTREARYARRWVTERALPEGADKATLPKRDKEGRYGRYTEYLIANDDPYTLDNTVLKMAKKRALVDAALHVGSLSSLFTQDVEDMGLDVDEEEQKVEKVRPVREEAVAREDKPTDAQVSKIGQLMRKLALSKETLRTLSMEMFGKASSLELTRDEAERLIQRLSTMDTTGEMPWNYK